MFIKYKSKNLLLPFLVFICFSFSLTSILSVISNGLNSELLFDYLIIFGKLLFASNSEPFSIIHNEPLWFLPCLFLVECIYYFLYKIKNRLFFCTVIALLYFVGVSFSNSLVRVFFPWNLCTALITVSFFAFGHCVLKSYFFFRKSIYFSKRIYFIIFSLISFSFCVPISLINGKISLGHNIVNNWILLFLTGVLGSVSILSLSASLKKSSAFVTYIGRNSLNIMGIHMIIVSMLHFILQNFFSIPNTVFEKNAVFAVLFFLSVLMISIIFVFFINKIKLVFSKQ